MQGELEKLDANLGGVADMRKQPDAVFIVDLRKEQLAVREARRLGLPVIALVDTNCDPDEADFVIPGNDDAIRSCSLVVCAIAEAIEDGRSRVTPQDFAAPAEGEEQADAAAPDAEEPAPEGEPAEEGSVEAEEASVEVAADAAPSEEQPEAVRVPDALTPEEAS